MLQHNTIQLLLRSTQNGATKFRLKNILYANATTNHNITINKLQKIIETTNAQLVITTTHFTKTMQPHHNHKQLILESDGSPP